MICRDMAYCSALNGLQIEEVYLPNNLNDLGTCRVLDELGNKVKNEVFGNGRSFRDTTQCNDIVMQYLCLFYGSNNDMYRNHCIYQEDVSDSNPVNHKVAPRPPCRSFCVQVAEVCANDPKFMQLCNNIECLPMEDSCTLTPVSRARCWRPISAVTCLTTLTLLSSVVRPGAALVVCSPRYRVVARCHCRIIPFLDLLETLREREPNERVNKLYRGCLK